LYEAPLLSLTYPVVCNHRNAAVSFLFLLPGLSACACSPARTSYGGAAAREMEHRCQVGPSQQYAGLSSGDQTRAPRPHSRGVQARAGRRPAGLSSRGAPGPVGLVGWSGVAAAPRRSCCGAAVSNSSGGKLRSFRFQVLLFLPFRRPVGPLVPGYGEAGRGFCYSVGSRAPRARLRLRYTDHLRCKKKKGR